MSYIKSASNKVAELFESTNRLVNHYIESIHELDRAYQEAMDFFTQEDIFKPENVSKGIEKLIRLRNASGNIILLTGSFSSKEDVETEMFKVIGETLGEQGKKKKRLKIFGIRRTPLKVEIMPKEISEVKTAIDRRIDEAIDFYITTVYRVRELQLDKDKDREEIELMRAEVLEVVGKAISDAYSYGIASLRAVANSSVISVLKASLVFIRTLPRSLIREETTIVK